MTKITPPVITFSHEDDLGMAEAQNALLREERRRLVIDLKRAYLALDAAGLEIPHGRRAWWKREKAHKE